MAVPVIDSLELMKNVHTFYNDSWNSLITIFTIFLTIVGVIWPIAIGAFYRWIQNRDLKLKEDEVEKRLTESFNAKYKLLKEDIETNLKKDVSMATAGVYYLQAQSYKKLVGDENKKIAFESFIISANCSIVSQSDKHIKLAVGQLLEVFKEISTKSILSEHKGIYIDLIKNIESYNKNYWYDEIIKDMKNILNKIPDEVTS